jgi:hypothetical protein
MLGSAHAMLLGAAGRPRISSIALTAIDAWAADADDSRSIASSSGGTMPVIPVTVDPTPYVSGASGDKTNWLVQFQSAVLGTWTRLAGGDLQYTPGSTPGTEDAEYRVSDDAGATWSDWQAITIEVVERPAGAYHLVEDYAGTEGQKVQAAIDAAHAAGGGVVTTLDRDTTRVMDGVTRSDASVGLTWREKVHLLGLKVRQPNATDGDGNQCSPTGNGVATGWSPGYWDDLVRGGTAWGAAWDNSTRQEAVLCEFDGNATKMALHSTSGDNSEPNSTYGTCFPGNRLANGNDVFNLQQQAGVRLRGTTDGSAANRRRARFKRCKILRTCGDGLNNVGGMDVELHDCLHEDCFRGSPNMIGGNSRMVIVRNTVRIGSANINGRIDHETETFGSRDSELTHTDTVIGGLFDMIPRSSTTSPGSVYVVEGCDVGPQLNLIPKNCVQATVTFRGTVTNPRGKIRFHVQGGGKYSVHPACRIGGWAGRLPHTCQFLFEDQDFIAHGDPYIFNTETFTPGADYFHIRLGETVQAGDGWAVTLINCKAYWQNRPAGATARLFDAVRTLTTAEVVRIDGLEIGSGFLLDAVELDGQRLEYRNVSHADFPAAGIQDICPGAGEYVAL